MADNFKTKLRNKQVLIGTLVSIGAPEVAEMLSMVGFDYLWIDAEHASMGFPTVQRLLQAVGGRCPCLVRVPENREVWIKKALDTGCDGIIVPQVKTAEEARRAVEWTFYPPLGGRSVGVSRCHGYGTSFQEYVDTANDRLSLVLQVEHVEGVKNAAQIAGVPGVDCVLVGPFDLSGSMDLLGEVTHPQVREAIETIRRHTEEAGVASGIFAVDADFARRSIGEGFTLICLGLDAFFLWQRAQAVLAEVRRG